MDARNVTMRETESRYRHLTIVTLYVLLLSVLPVLVTVNPPLHDYQFHIARMDILERFNQSADLRSYYDWYSMWLPNIGMDAVVLALMNIMSVEWAGRVFIMLTLALQLFGCALLHDALVRFTRIAHDTAWSEQINISYIPLMAAFFLYNWIFLFGFLNYLFGLGIVLIAMAAWIRLDIDGSVVKKLIYGTVFACLLYACHLIAFGLFAVMVAGFQLQRAWTMRPIQSAGLYLMTGACIFLIPIIVFFFSPTSQGSHFTSHSLINLFRTPLIFVRILMAGNWYIDATLIIVAIVVVPFISRVRLFPAMRLPVAFLVLTYLIMPHELFGGWGADSRIPVLIAFVLCSSIYLKEPPTRDAAQRQLQLSRRMSGVLLVVLMFRCVLMTWSWQSYDLTYATFRTAFRSLPPGSVLFSASEYPPPSLQDINLRLWHPPLASVASLAVLEVHDIFVPQTWATYGQQPIAVTPRYRPLYELQNNVAARIVTDEDMKVWVEKILRVSTEANVSTQVFLLLLYPFHAKIALPAGASVAASGEDFLLLSLSR